MDIKSTHKIKTVQVLRVCYGWHEQTERFYATYKPNGITKSIRISNGYAKLYKTEQGYN